MGAWRDLTEYHEAVQHPPRAFADPGLKAVTLELDRFGMPKPATGGNAVVYKGNEPGGLLTFKKTWAIRCFLRPISDHAERYEAISKHLRKVRLPYDVNFQFLKQGIQIRSNWFPIVKMQWAKGDLLHSHIEKHLGYPAALAVLRAKWAILVRHLEAAQVAHGDLQHGNILVRGGSIHRAPGYYRAVNRRAQPGPLRGGERVSPILPAIPRVRPDSLDASQCDCAEGRPWPIAS